MRQLSKISLACAVAALAISPTQAVELPRAAAPVAKTYAVQTVLNDGADEAEHGRRYRRHRDDGIDAGDVIAGALIIGGIFAVASAVDSSNKRDDRYDQDYQANADFDRAVDACVNRVGRDERVGSAATAFPARFPPAGAFPMSTMAMAASRTSRVAKPTENRSTPPPDIPTSSIPMKPTPVPAPTPIRGPTPIRSQIATRRRTAMPSQPIRAGRCRVSNTRITTKV